MVEKIKKPLPHEWSFKGDKEKYLIERDRGELPKELETLKGSMEWPIDPGTSNFHLNCFFDMPNCGHPSSPIRHWGVDIQVGVGTPVIAPENGQIWEISINERQAMPDMKVIGDSGIYYILGHMDWGSIPEKFAEARGLKVGERITLDRSVKRGEVIGAVGYFGEMFGEYRDTLTEDVKEIYGFFNHHLHVGAWYKWETAVNPLLLFRRLV